jgi:facilitator of iron transport 1
MLANTPPATGRRYTNAENAHTSGTFDSAARRATATTAATSATASTGASALTAASAAAASVTAQSPASATSANAPEPADAAKPAVADAGAANPGAVRRRSLFTAVPQPVSVDEDSDDETIQVPVVREDLIPDSFSAASAVSASAASASATSAAESASAAETVSAAETTSAAETSSSVSAASAPSTLEHSSAATSPASASDDVAPESTAQADQADQADQEAVDSVQELNDAHEVEAAAVPLPTDFDAPSAISIPTPPHTVSSALSAESTFSIDSAVSAASAASSVGITLPSAATPAPAVPVTPAPAVPVTPAAGATDTASNELSKTTPAADAPEPPAPPAPEQPEATSVEADFADDEVVASDHTETTIMDAADMELEEVVKPVVTSTSPVGVERLDHLATADSADLAPVAPSPSSAIFASTRTAAFSDSANQSDADNEVDDDVLLAGSTVVGKPASRAAAHWGGTLLALVLFPIAWFLMHTAANALTGALADGWPKVFSTAGIIELGMAIVLLIVVMATATRSSLGTFVTGITTLLIGLPFVVVPSITKQYLGDFLANMALQSRFGRILSEAILLDGVSGRLVIIGLFLIMLGVVSHSTRRAGRRERLVMDRANTKK